ncbi:MAG: hypothetical protein WCD79_08675 [Chthoniobacteraceae bacterium]
MDFSNKGGGSFGAGPAGVVGAGVDEDAVTDSGDGTDELPAAASAGRSLDIRNAGEAAALSGASETGRGNGSAACDGIVAERHTDATNSLSRR